MNPLLQTTLNGTYVLLQPLQPQHSPALTAIAQDPSIWQYTLSAISTLEDMQHYVNTAMEEYNQGKSLPFITCDKQSGEIVGSTRFGNIVLEHRRLEIGWTWITPKWQRTYINTEAKYLMLKYAFEELGCMRVEIKTDQRNRRSQDAIKRLGAQQEGIFRNHMLLPGGDIRNTIYFSIIDSEWPNIKAILEAKLAANITTGAPSND